jgi:predicted permease
MLQDLKLRLRSIFRRRTVEYELDEELRFHVEEHIATYVRRGIPVDEAVRRVRLEFGGLEQIKEEHRGARGTRFVDEARRDIRDAARQLTRSPGFATAAVLSLALGIGGNAAIFSIVDVVLLRPLPYPDASRLVRIDGVFTRLPLVQTETGIELAGRVTAPELADARAFVHIGAYTLAGLNLSAEEPERLRAAAVTPGFFAALGVVPANGRVFTDQDLTQTDRLAVISFRLWQQRFAGDSSIAGRSVDLNGRAFSIVGVLPRGVDFPDASDIWIPQAADPQVASQPAVPSFVARLAPGVTPSSAREEVFRLVETGALTRQDGRSSNLRVTPLHEALVGNVRPVLVLVLAAGLLVLVVACLNTANLLLARTSAREREFAVRRAMGASTLRLVRQVLCESGTLAAAAAVIAVPVAFWTLQTVRTFIPPTLPGAEAIAIDLRTFLGLAAMALLAAGLFGLAPAISAGARASNILRAVSASSDDKISRRFRSVLVISEIALALVVLVCATALIRTVTALMATDVGARNETALVMEITLPRATYASADRIRHFYNQLRTELRTVPGVSEAGATNHLPGTQTVLTPSVPLTLAGAGPGEINGNALRLSATPGYFSALGVDVLAGRPFTEADRSQTTPVAIVSEGYARSFGLQARDILGRRVKAGWNEKRWAEIVGVVRDVRMRGPESGLQPAVYLPFTQVRVNATGFVVANAGSHPHTIAEIRAAVARIDPGLPLYNVRTFGQIRSEYLAARRFAMTTMMSFGIVAFALAALGLYAVVNYMVRLRTREIAIRMAIGAPPARVRRQVLNSGILHGAAGIGIGSACAVAAWRIVSAHVSGVGPLEGMAVTTLCAIIFLACVAAAWVPANRAARIDPLPALRTE